MYRIAVITDIHGNCYALDAVLKDIKNKSVDHIYCLGDMIGIGPFSNEVLSALFARDNISLITGNHDEAVLALLNGKAYPKSRINVMQHHAWIGGRLDKDFLPKLHMLPRFLTLKLHDEKIHFTHYPMKVEFRDAPICDDPFDQTGRPSLENFSRIHDLNEFSLICFGHDHEQFHMEDNDKTYYSPGSLGIYNKPFARYGIIDIAGTGIHIKQQHVPYDMNIYLNSLRALEIPRKEIILGLYR